MKLATLLCTVLASPCTACTYNIFYIIITKRNFIAIHPIHIFTPTMPPHISSTYHQILFKFTKYIYNFYIIIVKKVFLHFINLPYRHFYLYVGHPISINITRFGSSSKYTIYGRYGAVYMGVKV